MKTFLCKLVYLASHCWWLVGKDSRVLALNKSHIQREQPNGRNVHWTTRFVYSVTNLPEVAWAEPSVPQEGSMDWLSDWKEMKEPLVVRSMLPLLFEHYHPMNLLLNEIISYIPDRQENAHVYYCLIFCEHRTYTSHCRVHQLHYWVVESEYWHN